MLIFLLS